MNYKPAYKYWLHLMAQTYADEGKSQEAMTALKDLKWIKDKLGYWSTPYDRAFFMDAAGQIYEELEKPQDAEGAYRDALEYNPHYALAHFHLGRLYLAGWRKEDALAELKIFQDEWANADLDVPEIVALRRMMDQMSR